MATISQRQKNRTYGSYNKALKNGTLKRHPCKVCGEEKVDGHHTDYFYPLKVVWLCKKHHMEWHKNNKVKIYTSNKSMLEGYLEELRIDLINDILDYDYTEKDAMKIFNIDKNKLRSLLVKR